MSTDIDIVRKMGDQPVLVIGDIMLDRFIYGRVDRISPESPVPVLSIQRENDMLGGAGNTLSNLVHLKCNAMILSIIGDDRDGQRIEDLAGSYGVNTRGLIRIKDRPTIRKTRYLAGHQQLLRADYERADDITAEIEKQLVAYAKDLIARVRAVIISDYGKGMLTPSFLGKIIALAGVAGVPVLVDPKGRDYSIYAGADIVTPNKKELAEATGGKMPESDSDIIDAAQELIKISGIGAVVATRSKDGMSVIARDRETVHIRSAADIEVFDVSGAGDTVIATIAAAIAAGADLVQAAAIANVAGSIVVAKVGTAPIRADELLNVLGRHDPHGDVVLQNSDPRQPRYARMRQAPLLSWQDAREEVLRWRARGLKLGFTNGCFDILHYGHVTYLNEARSKCDRLILGLNKDSSIRVLKGPDRPVHNEESRAAVIGALGSVDMVVLFGAEQEGEDNTACKLLEFLQPDIYFKGGDYTIDQIPEAPTVLRYGGCVDVMPVYEGHSTTASIAKARKNQAA